MEGWVNEKPVKSEDDGLDVIALFRGLQPEQAQQLAKRIKEALPHLREEVINPRITGNLDSGAEPQENDKMSEQDDDVLRKLGELQDQIESLKKEKEADRLRELDEAELAELATLPRGVVGIKARSNVSAKYQELRFGRRTDSSLDWLKAQRDANQELSIPDTDNQRELMSAYRKAIAPWRGQVGKVSAIQAQFRVKGLKGI